MNPNEKIEENQKGLINAKVIQPYKLFKLSHVGESTEYQICLKVLGKEFEFSALRDFLLHF